MSTLVAIVVAVLIFGVLIISHEFGHFIAARKCGVDVLEFSAGMGPLLFKKEKNGTQYSVRLLPIGGYCRMKGEEEDEDGNISEEEGTLYGASPLKRIIILAAGATMNFLIAVLIFFIIICMNGTDATTKINTVSEGSPAYMAGIQPGDKIISINGDEIKEWNDITSYIREGDGSAVTVTVKRSGETLTFVMTPEYSETENAYLIGITPKVRTNIFTALGKSFYFVGYYIVLIFGLFADLIRGNAGIESFSGPIGATVIIGQYIPYGVMYVLEIAASISVSLGFFNLLPIPALDGSRIFFSLIELIKGSPLNRNVENIIHTVGMIALLAFAAFIAYRDVITYIL